MINLFKIMTQKNEMSARALTMAELVNVNGGNYTGAIGAIGAIGAKGAIGAIRDLEARGKC